MNPKGKARSSTSSSLWMKEGKNEEGSRMEVLSDDERRAGVVGIDEIESTNPAHDGCF